MYLCVVIEALEVLETGTETMDRAWIPKLEQLPDSEADLISKISRKVCHE